MPVRNNLLKKHKNYYFSVFYGIDVSTIEKINYKSFGINCIKIFSPEFDKLSTEIEDWEYMVKEEFDLIKFYHAEDISCLFYSETENSIADFYNFLTILRPSNVKEWLTFDTFYSKSNNNSTNLPHHTNGYSIWKTIHELYNNLKNEDIFYLSGKDILFVNKLIIKYSSLKRKQFFLKFLSLYRRAYFEEKDYFKYLLLFMIIESFINDSDTTGVVYKIRRLCAVLIGTTIADCEMIFAKTKDAYTIRSKLVHSAKNEITNTKYLPYLHSLVCELGILILISDLNSDNIFKISTQLGFCQRQTLISEKSFKSYTQLSANWRNFHSLGKN